MTEHAEIAARLAAATPGPWELNEPTYSVVVLGSNGYPVARADDRVNGRNQSHADADFIAHAPSDIAFLLAENTRLEAALKAGWSWGQYQWALTHPDELPAATPRATAREGGEG